MKKLCTAFIFVLMGYSLPAYSVDGINIDLGSGEESATLVGVSAKWNWDSQWFNEGDWYVGGYWELGAGYWDGKSGEHRNSEITHIGVTPVFRLTRHNAYSNGVKPFFEGAIGFHLMSDDKFGDKDLGTEFTFGDHISGGIQFGEQQKHELSLRLQHFSNAGLDSSNPGINFGMLRYGYNFQ
jgi:hypothetical protein